MQYLYSIRLSRFKSRPVSDHVGSRKTSQTHPRHTIPVGVDIEYRSMNENPGHVGQAGCGCSPLRVKGEGGKPLLWCTPLDICSASMPPVHATPLPPPPSTPTPHPHPQCLAYVGCEIPLAECQNCCSPPQRANTVLALLWLKQGSLPCESTSSCLTPYLVRIFKATPHACLPFSPLVSQHRALGLVGRRAIWAYF